MKIASDKTLVNASGPLLAEEQSAIMPSNQIAMEILDPFKEPSQIVISSNLMEIPDPCRYNIKSLGNRNTCPFITINLKYFSDKKYIFVYYFSPEERNAEFNENMDQSGDTENNIQSDNIMRKTYEVLDYLLNINVSIVKFFIT